MNQLSCYIFFVAKTRFFVRLFGSVARDKKTQWCNTRGVTFVSERYSKRFSDTVLIHIIDGRRQERLRKAGKSQMTIYTKNLWNIKRLGPSSGWNAFGALARNISLATDQKKWFAVLAKHPNTHDITHWILFKNWWRMTHLGANLTPMWFVLNSIGFALMCQWALHRFRFALGGLHSPCFLVLIFF